VDGVGVGEEKPFAAGCSRSGGDGVVLAGPTGRQGAGFDDPDLDLGLGFRKCGCDVTRAVGGMVVDDDDLNSDSALRVAL